MALNRARAARQRSVRGFVLDPARRETPGQKTYRVVVPVRRLAELLP